MKNVVIYILVSIALVSNAYPQDSLFIYNDTVSKGMGPTQIYFNRENLIDQKSRIYGVSESIGLVYKDKKPIPNIGKYSEVVDCRKSNDILLTSTIVFYVDIFNEYVSFLFLKYKAQQGFDTLSIRNLLLERVKSSQSEKVLDEMECYKEWAKRAIWFNKFSSHFSISSDKLAILSSKKAAINISAIQTHADLVKLRRKMLGKKIFWVTKDTGSLNLYIAKSVYLSN